MNYKQRKAGDVVSWKSRSNHLKAKLGIITEVIPAGTMHDGVYRDHESYMVMVYPIGNAKPKEYWPSVSQFRSAGPAQTRTVRAREFAARFTADCMFLTRKVAL